jgi:hypothetical protein
MTRLYLQEMVDNIPFDGLPVPVQGSGERYQSAVEVLRGCS